MRDEVALIEERTGARLSEAWLAEFRERRNQALDRDLVEIPGAPDAVRALHGILDGRIAVASGADRRKVEFQLAKVGIADCFDGRVFSGHEMPRSKPFPDVYLAAAESLGADPRRCAVVETPSPAPPPAWRRAPRCSATVRAAWAIAAPTRCALWAWRASSPTCATCPACWLTGPATIWAEPDPSRPGRAEFNRRIARRRPGR